MNYKRYIYTKSNEIYRKEVSIKKDTFTFIQKILWMTLFCGSFFLLITFFILGTILSSLYFTITLFCAVCLLAEHSIFISIRQDRWDEIIDFCNSKEQLFLALEYKKQQQEKENNKKRIMNKKLSELTLAEFACFKEVLK